MTKEIKKILIIEDEKPIARALELKLGSVGFETKIEYDGEAALKTLRTAKFNLIVLDLVLPKVDGFEILQKLKQDKDKTPIIVLTNLGQEEDEQRALDSGAKRFFVKSDTPLIDIVNFIQKSVK